MIFNVDFLIFIGKDDFIIFWSVDCYDFILIVEFNFELVFCDDCFNWIFGCWFISWCLVIVVEIVKNDGVMGVLVEEVKYYFVFYFWYEKLAGFVGGVRLSLVCLY